MEMNRLAVVGLGYVGLPLAHAAAASGYKVVGYDKSAQVITNLNLGKSHIDDLSDLEIAEMVENGFVATDDKRCFKDADVIVICVPTPLSRDGGPDLTAVLSVANEISENITDRTLIILESTTFPGTTEDLVLPILKSSSFNLDENFWLAFSPERIDPGNKKFNIVNTPKVVGGVTKVSSQLAFEFYSSFVETVVIAKGAREAELAKLLENTYRHVNIALMNEMVDLCNLLKIDLWNSIECAATKPFGFQAFFPGPGVGGHCIPIDPNYLSHHVKSVLGRPFRFVELAQEINAGMPEYVFRRAQEALNEKCKSIRSSKILLVGVTYKADIADQRESPAIPLAKILISQGAELSFYDPYVELWNVDDTHDSVTSNGKLARVANLDIAVNQSDLVILLQNHSSIDLDKLVDSQTLILDTRGKLTGVNVVRL